MTKKKIRILHVIKSLGRGGAEVLLPETLRLHDQDTYEFHYIYFLPWKDQMVGAIVQAGGKVTCFAAINNLMLALRYWSVRRYARENSIDLVHCHLPWAGFLGRLLFKFAGLKVVYTEHNKQERYHWVTRWLNKFTFDWQSAVIAVSSDAAQSIKQNIKHDVRIVEIYNGVDTERFRRDEVKGSELRASLGIPKESVVVGIVSVFRFQKRLSEWLEVFASVQSRDVYGLIIGDGPLKSELVARRDAMNLHERVIMPGLQKNVIPWLSAMDIFMMTSVFEGMPIALLEAMSVSCAVCTTDAGGIKQVIVNGKNGFIVGVDQWQTLRPVLSDLVNNAQLRMQVGEVARQTIINDFNMPRMVTSLERLYLSILNLQQTA